MVGRVDVPCGLVAERPKATQGEARSPGAGELVEAERLGAVCKKPMAAEGQAMGEAQEVPLVVLVAARLLAGVYEVAAAQEVQELELRLVSSSSDMSTLLGRYAVIL